MDILKFGIFFDLPVLALLLCITIASRRRVLSFVREYRVPRLLAFIVFSIVLLIVEENINCGEFECQTSLWPPTMNFLIALTCILGVIGVFLNPKNTDVFIMFACFLGLFFEVLLGGSAEAFRQLDPFWFVLVSALTLVSYGCIFFLPLNILLED